MKQLGVSELEEAARGSEIVIRDSDSLVLLDNHAEVGRFL